jgi:hypothetical protein
MSYSIKLSIEIKQYIEFLNNAVFLENIQYTKTKRVTTIIDAVNGVELGIIKPALSMEKMYFYFLDNSGNCCYNCQINRAVFYNSDLKKHTLPLQWADEDLPNIYNNNAIKTTKRIILQTAMNYFSKHIDHLKTIETGACMYLIHD